MTYFNIITSKGSRNSYAGLGKISLVLTDEKEIVSIAADQAGRSGESLERFCDVNYIENSDGDLVLERDLADEELLDAAIAQFTEDGYVYEIFIRGEQDAEFITCATDFGLEDEAIAFCE